MGKHLVIVESPAKAKTIKKYLGKDFEVLASYGHVRDLVPKEGAVDPERDFAMQYEIIPRNLKHVEAISKALKQADDLFLATDPDREGEAISWHLYEILRERGQLKDKPVHRVAFYEITRQAVNEAISNPRTLSNDLIDAQQARRALDYLVGFNLSPLLWRKIRRGLSAGRVQSPALRMIVEREEEIERFVRQEYWTADAKVACADTPFNARLTHLQGRKLSQFDIGDAENAAQTRTALLAAAEGRLTVAKLEKKQRKRNPAPPFTTSTLQQEAARKLGFTTRRTMQVAQNLYEGIDLGAGPVGLITYMRTDSVNLADEAIGEIRALISERYGKDAVPATPNRYRTKSKNAQEAHEAVRPTSAARLPDELKSRLSQDQFRLYELIWKRTVASQMIHATLDTVSADLEGGEGNLYRATGSALRDPGFMAVYREGLDDAEQESDNRLLPPMTEGEALPLNDIVTEQHFTEPPPRYSEASLVKALEEHGIGRPSTYAAIISTLLGREYVELESRRFTPTDVGRVVNRFLTQHFTQYVDYDFTARMEDSLDEISRGEKHWIPVLHEFWKDFHALVEDRAQTVTRDEALQAREIGIDPTSGKPVSVRMGRYGPFAQIGSRDDEDKPRFAGLKPGQKMDTVTLEEALKLFDLPRQLGENPDGLAVSANIGRFGPYVKYGPKYCSLKGEDDPYTVTLERALELIAEKERLEAERVILRFERDGAATIEVLRGRYGPYITDGERNARMPKDAEPEKLDIATCESLLAAAPPKKSRRTAAKAKTKAATPKAAAKPKTSPKKKTATRKKASPKTAAATKKDGGKTATKRKSPTTAEKAKTGTAARQR
ncbi:DNA topoisomerase I [Acidihalobacter yilgarnensis]|uniref:DNA topoisomerase 1 n=1 Tax=Acidihalobacter yilgarnensis TaxID=2819280 RepID=A0A1D8IJS6_9GAMM|nr:DNA topoisomerase I [Acidihalobacter yilgarnensis]AOU96722.1 DNA topoisomerase I [Acidihalobacter yilgarnensis]